MHTPYTDKTIQQMKDNIPHAEIIKTLKEDLSEMKSKQREWLKEAHKELDRTPSYESPRISKPSFYSEITDLQLAIATVTDFDISKSIFPQNRGEIIYALEKDPHNIFFVRDKLLSTENFDYAFELLPKSKNIGYREKESIKKELFKAIFFNNKQKADQLVDGYIKKIDEIIQDNNSTNQTPIVNNEQNIDR